MASQNSLLKFIGYISLVLIALGFFVRDVPIIVNYVSEILTRFRDTSVQTFEGHNKIITAVAFSPDGKRVVSGGLGTDPLRLWDIASGKLIRPFKNEVGIVKSLVISADSREIFVGGSSKLQKLDIANSTILQNANLTDVLEDIGSMAYSSENQSVLIGSKLFLERNIVNGGSYFGIATVVDLAKEGTQKRLPGIWSKVPIVRFSPDGKLALSANGRNRFSRINKAFSPLVLWNVDTWKTVGKIEAADFSIYSAAFSPDSGKIATADTSNKIKLWNIETKTSVRTFAGHTSFVNTMEFSKDGRLLVSGSADGTVKLWNVTTGYLLETFIGHQGAVNTVAFSADGQTVASGSNDKTLKLWDISAFTQPSN